MHVQLRALALRRPGTQTGTGNLSKATLGPDDRPRTLPLECATTWYCRAMATNLRALIIAYAFPPVGGAGVQRTVKLAKYLREFDIEPAALTVSNPSVPLEDTSMYSDFPDGMHVHRARTLEPRYSAKKAAWTAAAAERLSFRSRVRQSVIGLGRRALIPDPQLLWLPGAAFQLRQILGGASRPDVVLISAPPFSQFLLVPLLRLIKRVGVVLDYRDEWSTARTTYEMLEGRLAAKGGELLERAVVTQGHVITTATEAFRDNLLRAIPRLSPKRVRVVTNGFDPDDFPVEIPAPPDDRFVVKYAGTIFKLTSARGLLGAVRRLHERDPILAKRLEVQFIGRVVDAEQATFEGMDKLGVRQVGYVAHSEVLSRLGSSHEVLCLLDDVRGVERIYPGKIFELMYLGRPILTLAPPGALERLVKRHELGVVIHPRDEVAIAEYLAKQIEAFRRGRHRSRERLQFHDTSRYHRRELASLFADAMRAAHAMSR